MTRRSLRNITLPVKVRLLSLACNRIRKVAAQRPVGKFDVFLLMLAWGNIGYAASLSYLRHLAIKVQQTKGPMLECGSGASTLLIASLTSEEQSEIVVLENSKEWYDYMSAVLDQLGFDHIRLQYAPLTEYSDYAWYSVSKEWVSEPIQLVVCDGPPGTTRGGRYGLVPVMDELLGQNCLVLLDDTHRKGEREIIHAWQGMRSLRSTPIGILGAHSEVVLN